MASLSTGEGPFRVDGPCEALFLAWEDDEASGILPHLLACGGDPRKVHMLRGVTDEEGRQIPWMPTPANIELVRDFLVCHPQVKLLVVDDVMTTGATLSAAADALLRAGASSVSGLCFARTPADH